MAKSSAVYRVDIAPLTPLPLTKVPFFSYRSALAVPLGSLVEIPFGRRTLKGIVFASHPLPGRAPLWLKPITRVIFPAWLTDAQRHIAEFVSEQYFSSLGNTLKHFVFPLPKHLPEGRPAKAPKTRRTQPSRGAKELHIELSLDSELIRFLEAKVRSRLKQQGTLFLLVPDLLLAHSLERRLHAIAKDQLVTITSRLTPKKLLDAWEALKNGQGRIVIGTRQALFAPLSDLRDIIVLFPEERLSYKQWDMTPRYEALPVAQAWAKRSGARLTWLTTSPGLTSIKRLKSKEERLIQKPTIIDRRLDGKGARAKVFAKTLGTALGALPPQAKVLLLAKERGVAGVLACQNCRAIARCPECQHVLGETISGSFRCLTCGYASSLFPACRSCGHMSFKSFGHGTAKVEAEWERLFPRQTIWRLDRDSLATAAGWRESTRRLERGDFDTLVTTPEIGTLLSLPPLDLIAMLDGDQALAFPGYDHEERLLIQVKRLVAKLAPGGNLFIQTFTPEERLWRAFQSGETATIEAELLEERSLLGYPPEIAMIQIRPGKDAGISREAFGRIRERLASIVANLAGYRITDVFESRLPGRGHTDAFLIKYPPKAPLPRPLVDCLKRESGHLMIDVHPLQTER